MKKTKTVILLLVLILLVTACSSNTQTQPNGDYTRDYASIIKNADEIIIKENAISLGKKYDVYVKDEKVATVQGKVFNDFGDVFTMTDPNGKFLIRERQLKRWGMRLTRAAQVEDEQGNVLGFIGEETLTKLLSIGHTFHFFDKDQNEIGLSDEVNFSLLKQNKFYDNKRNLDYEVFQQFNLFDIYTLKVHDTKDIPVLNAILMVTIEDAIKDSEASKNNSSKKK